VATEILKTNLTKKDFETDQDVRWCPGCGDYSILANVQKLMPELGIPREKIVWVSGIGCSSRFPYYMNTYGFHTIHGRAPAFATGIKVANPELSVWLATGDGDGLSIGGNQLMHCLRRNVEVKILLFNNRIYGLTKGQYSPTSEVGKVTKSTPMGSADYPIDPCTFALGAGASFVGRTVDVQAKEFGVVLKRAALHPGGTFTEVYQNCNVFNDDAFVSFTEKSVKEDRQIFVEHGKPLLFGEGKKKGLRIDARTLSLEVVTVGENGVTEEDILVHDETNSTIATMLARMPFPAFPVAMGVLYAVPRATYEHALTGQHERARSKLGTGSLEKLLHSGETWTV
jgi:2-oxoglutarate ferredoxin oxidoreductase subunit beta